MNLTLDAFVSADMNLGGSPPLGHGQDQERHTLFGEGHEAVVVVFTDQIEWGSNILGDSYAETF